MFVGFTIGGVTQLLRWIRPDRFRMRSPVDEPGRVVTEGPEHEVTIGRGFWLFDTPCTQALWQAVMGENPSRFKSPDRPVENVSWDDCQVFLELLNERVAGLELCLPSEAQWEYACRAGTKTASYVGPIEILGKNNAPSLDPIAWYGGNSGEGFDLDDGYDSSGWRDKQYPHTKAGTRPVKKKKPNAWGLYDMLGNVWEWCSDGHPESGPATVTDPIGSLESGSRRVRRGGSWHNDARSVRSAYRRWSDPGRRSDNLGFRCALGQD